MKELNTKFWDHEPRIEKKKPGLIKRILIIILSIIIFLVVGFVSIGIFYHPNESSNKEAINQVTTDSCKYQENNSVNILALINEFRISQSLPAFAESASLSKYQEALLDELQKK